MSCKKMRLPLSMAAIVLLGACNTAQTHIGETDPFLGESVKYNAALQTINPAPVYPPESAQAGDNGDVGAHAVKRYRSGQAKPVETMSTTSGTSGSSGGSTR